MSSLASLNRFVRDSVFDISLYAAKQECCDFFDGEKPTLNRSAILCDDVTRLYSQQRSRHRPHCTRFVRNDVRDGVLLRDFMMFVAAFETLLHSVFIAMAFANSSRWLSATSLYAA